MVNEFLKDSAGGVLGRIPGLSQDVLITPAVLAHVQKHRQLTMFAKEAGGQLFGTILTNSVHILFASGPYPEDERSRNRYRSDSAAAQQEIKKQSARGLLYLGEWHAHAEDRPSASNLDDTAMRKILSDSKLNTDALLMLIVGRYKPCAGLGLWTVSPHDVKQWILRPLKD